MKNAKEVREVIKGIFEIVEQVIRYNLVWVSLRLLNREAVYEKRIKINNLI
jgi:hypothetical protein